MTIDTLRLSLDKQPLTIRTNYIILYLVYRRTLSSFCIKQHTNLFTRLKRVLLDTLSVTTQLGIRFSVT